MGFKEPAAQKGKVESWKDGPQKSPDTRGIGAQYWKQKVVTFC